MFIKIQTQKAINRLQDSELLTLVPIEPCVSDEYAIEVPARATKALTAVLPPIPVAVRRRIR
jgi:hypothetical protein